MQQPPIFFTCSNCFRCPPYERGSTAYQSCPYKLSTVEVDLHVLPRFMYQRKFCNVIRANHPVDAAGRRVAYLCGQCYAYLSPEEAPSGISSLVWPAYIWQTLRSSATQETAWSLLPVTWRKWWIASYVDLFDDPQNPEELLSTATVFRDVTPDVEADLAALENLRWGADMLPRESSFVIANVKCPAGCIEFKHKTNSLPLDIVWEYCLGKDTALYSSRKHRDCTNWFRSDYYVHEDVLLNPEWKATPSILFCRTDCVPLVLCCRHHSTRNKKFALHPCRSVTPSIATEKAGQMSPVTPVPRTLRRAQVSAYSASFHIAKMEGCYSGLDTMFLSEGGGNYSHQSKLAWKQEVLAYNSRSDIRAHVTRMVQENTIPLLLQEALVDDKDHLFPNWNLALSTAQEGSTYISMEDSVRLQHNLFYDRLEKTRVPSQNRYEPSRLVTFRGVWPQNITHVHPGGCSHGARFPALPLFRRGIGARDGRTAWLLVSMLVSIPELWRATTKVHKPIDRWEGWVLKYCTSKCFPHLSLKGTKESPFRKKISLKRLFSYIQPGDEADYDPETLYEKFKGRSQLRRFENVKIFWNTATGIRELEEDIVIVLRKAPSVTAQRRRRITRPMRPGFLGTFEHNEWDLRYLAISTRAPPGENPTKWNGSIYMRHGGQDHFSWWKQNQSQERPHKMPPNWTVATGLSSATLNLWTACVYVRRHTVLLPELRSMVMGACGGQTDLCCSQHQQPLVVTKQSKKQLCSFRARPRSSCCAQKANYICVETNCLTGVCKNHLEVLCRGSTRRPVYCAPMPFSEYASHMLDSDSDSEGHQSDGNERCEDTGTQPGCFLNVRQGLDDADFYDETPEDFRFVELGMEDDPPNNIPTTSAIEEAVYANSQDRDDFSKSLMTNHALLNCYGSCLVRRNKKLSGTIAQQHFLQKQAARKYGTSIPLVYPEGMLFSDVFPLMTKSGSIIGAIPASHLHGDNILSNNGFCTLQETYRTRLMNPSLLASCNPKYHFFVFDALANFALRGTDSRIILRRGFAENQGSGGVCIRGKKEPVFDSEHVENRAVVCKLSASTGEEMPTYFYTHSLSMRTHYGMKLLWEWLTGDEIVQLHCNESTDKEIYHWRKCIIDSAGAYLLRVWMELSEIWLLYINKSPDLPMGRITKFFARFEFQDSSEKDTSGSGKEIVSKGNLPHIHCLFWTDEDLRNDIELFRACDRIRGFVDDLVRPNEAERYLAEGVFKTHKDIIDFKETMSRFLKHEHQRRCFVIRKDAHNEQSCMQKVCKVTNNWYLTRASAQHCMVPQEVNHSDESIRVMIDIGVGTRKKAHGFFNNGQVYEFIPLIDCLVAEKHVPPCHGNEGTISPVIGALVAVNPNSDNCQMANSYFVARYLAKYVVKIDEYCTVKIKPLPNEGNTAAYSVSGEQLLNTKITSNRIAQQKTLNRGHNSRQKNALGINISQVYMMLFGYPSVYTNLKHVKYSTDAYGDRAARERKAKPIDVFLRNNDGLQANALTALSTVAPHHARAMCPGLQNWRQFAATQVQKAFDDLHSPLVPDPVTVFGFRPPELRFVMHQMYYHRWFCSFNANCGHNINRQILYCCTNLSASVYLEDSAWIAADTKVIRVRAAALREIMAYLDKAPITAFSADDEQIGRNIRRQIRVLFRTLLHVVEYKRTGVLPFEVAEPQPIIDRYDKLARRFVTDLHDDVLPTPWTHGVKPTQSQRFLIHLLYKFGSFIDEYSLFLRGSLRNCYIAAGLMDPDDLSASSRKLMRKYFFHELRFLPCGTPTFDWYCATAQNVINDFFHSDILHSVELPSVLYCRLRRETSRVVASYIEEKQKSLVKNIIERLTDAGFSGLPTLRECLDATVERPISWDPSCMEQLSTQPDVSYTEQFDALQQIEQQFVSYKNSVCISPKGFCLVGGGGVGKTTCALIGLLSARCKGLNINATALVSERAQELGVEHLNCVYSMPRSNLNQLTPGQLAERTISGLYRHPEKLEFHRIIDVELVDEMGPIAAEVWSARDIVLKYIRNSTKPNGGKLDIVTFDHLQMHPIQGSHPLLCPLITSGYIFKKLEHSVRAAASSNWQELQAITRMTPEELDCSNIAGRFVKLLTEYCSFEEREEDVDPDVLFVYGRNAPIKIHEQKLYKQLDKDIASGTRTVVVSHSTDTEKNIEGRFTAASAISTKRLDAKMREQSRLYFFKGARYRITYNNSGKFSNGQLAFMAKVPDPEVVRTKRPISLLVAPPGSSYLPSVDDTEASLLQRNWTPQAIGIAPDNTVDLRFTTGRRSAQYGLQLYVGSTWHSTMGKTLSRVATRIDDSGGSRGPYSLWDPTQVVIMLSRTKLPQHTIFVTKDRFETARIIYRVLQKRSPFRSYLGKVLSELCRDRTSDNVPVVDWAKGYYRPKDVLIPPQSTGFVYVLVSTKDPKFIYIGSCQSLLIRYEQHNKGNGAQQTTPSSLRPWGLLAYISGFEENTSVYRAVENAWIARKQQLHHHDVCARSLLDIGRGLTQEFSDMHHLELMFHQGGTVSNPDDPVQVSSSESTEETSDEDDVGSVFSGIVPARDTDIESVAMTIDSYGISSDHSSLSTASSQDSWDSDDS